MHQRCICKRPAFLSQFVLILWSTWLTSRTKAYSFVVLLVTINSVEEIQLSWHRSISPAFPGSEAGKFKPPERRGSTRPLPVMALLLYSGRKMSSCYPWPDWDIWRAAVLLHWGTASPKVNQTFCFKAYLPFLWWKRQEILFQGTGGRHGDANHVIRTILQPVWTNRMLIAQGLWRRWGSPGPCFHGRTRSHQFSGGEAGRGPTGVQSSLLSNLIQRRVAVYAEDFNGQLSQRKTPNQRPGLLQRCLRQADGGLDSSYSNSLILPSGCW